MNHILPTSTASKHTTFGPDAFTPEFVKAVRAAASDAPPVTYDGGRSSAVRLRCAPSFRPARRSPPPPATDGSLLG